MTFLASKVTIDVDTITNVGFDEADNISSFTLDCETEGAYPIKGKMWVKGCSAPIKDPHGSKYPVTGYFLPVWSIISKGSEVIEVQSKDPRTNLDRLYDSSEAPDPIGIEGVAWIERQISGLDRIIVEGCFKGSKVTDPRIDFSDRTIQYFKPEVIQRRIGYDICSLADAITLTKAWQSLELTSDIVNKFINRIRESGKLADAITNSVIWADALDAVTVHPEDFIPGEQEAWEADAHDRRRQEAIDSDDFDALEALDRDEEQAEESATAHECFRWTPIGTSDYDFKPDWLRSQFKWYKKLIEQVKATTSCEELGKIKKRSFGHCGNHMQSSFFWWMCKIQQRKLERPGRANLKKLLKWLKKTDKPQGFLKKYLFDLKLNPKMKCLSNRQWTVAWNLLKAKGLARIGRPTAPVPPDDLPPMETIEYASGPTYTDAEKAAMPH